MKPGTYGLYMAIGIASYYWELSLLTDFIVPYAIYGVTQSKHKLLAF